MIGLIDIMFSGFFLLISLVLALLGTVFWIWMLVDAIQNKGLSDGEKICWVLAIIFLSFIGALVYFFVGRPRRHSPAHS